MRRVLYNCDPGFLPAGDAIRVLVGLRISICVGLACLSNSIWKDASRSIQRILFWGIDHESMLVGFAAESCKHRVFAVLPWASRVHLASAASRGLRHHHIGDVLCTPASVAFERRTVAQAMGECSDMGAHTHV